MQMSLKEQLKADLTAAIKARDELVRATLRMALTAIGNEEVAGSTVRQLSDDEVLAVLTREAKKRREAAAAFHSGGAYERQQRELDEGEVLERYLPQQLSEEALAELVQVAVAQAGASGPRAMGQVMKLLAPRVAGRAEGGRVAAAVRTALTN